MSQRTLDRLRGLHMAHLIESDGPGGAERIIASVAAELQAAGAENVVIAPAGGEGWLARELSGTGVQVELFRLDRPISPALQVEAYMPAGAENLAGIIATQELHVDQTWQPQPTMAMRTNQTVRMT